MDVRGVRRHQGNQAMIGAIFMIIVVGGILMVFLLYQAGVETKDTKP